MYIYVHRHTHRHTHTDTHLPQGLPHPLGVAAVSALAARTCAAEDLVGNASSRSGLTSHLFSSSMRTHKERIAV